MEETAQDEVAKFSTLDYVVFGAMLVISFLVGLLCGFRRNTSSSPLNYVQAKGSLSPPAIVLSLLGGAISSISVLGIPTEAYYFGAEFLVSFVGITLGMTLVYFILLPTFLTLNLVSINEYIELRYASLVLRKLSCLSQLLNLTLLMGVLLYAPSIALSTVTNLPSWPLMLVLGCVCTFYTTLGGVRAVVWTDVLQVIVMVLGPITIIALCITEVGSVGQAWDDCSEWFPLHFQNPSSAALTLSIFVRNSAWGNAINGFYLTLMFFGVNQAAFQRFSSMRSLQMAQRISLLTGVGWIILWSVFFFSGLAAYVVYHDCDPLASGKIRKHDMILPYLIMHRLGHLRGVAGLFVAAVCGAVLRSESNTIYDISDFYSGILSLILGLLVANIISIFTGVVNPQTLRTGVVAPQCERFYKYLWLKINGERNPHIQKEIISNS
ncbi:hypothetical protein O3P69_013694 [Scylla paramamosain]|uniref:Sodium-coupled monocarboxylate transporter 1 n=1 Tax=Scylla paramamosain TaxID=85552 RepID=A0AAW0SQ13_SCYPA